MSTLRAGRPGLHLDQLPTESLMKPFPMVVRHELLDHVPRVLFPEEDEMVQALVADRLDEPFCMRAGWSVIGSKAILESPVHDANV